MSGNWGSSLTWVSVVVDTVGVMLDDFWMAWQQHRGHTGNTGSTGNTGGQTPGLATEIIVI